MCVSVVIYVVSEECIQRGSVGSVGSYRDVV